MNKWYNFHYNPSVVLEIINGGSWWNFVLKDFQVFLPFPFPQTGLSLNEHPVKYIAFLAVESRLLWFFFLPALKRKSRKNFSTIIHLQYSFHAFTHIGDGYKDSLVLFCRYPALQEICGRYRVPKGTMRRGFLTSLWHVCMLRGGKWWVCSKEAPTKSPGTVPLAHGSIPTFHLISH